MNRTSHPTLLHVAASLGGAATIAAGLLLVLALLGVNPIAQAQTATPAPTVKTYKVQIGDSWTTVAARNGLSIAALQAANPGSMRANEWLIVGETLVIPGAPAPTATSATPVTATVAAHHHRRCQRRRQRSRRRRH